MDLIDAVRKNNPRITKQLLKQGANPNMIEDNHNITPLHYAVIYNSAQVVSVLIAAGADLKARDINGLTPREEALELGIKRKEICEILKKQEKT